MLLILNLWFMFLVLPVFDYGYSASNKRPLDGDPQCAQNRALNQNDLMHVFLSLRDQNAIQIALSLLSKIQNVLRDESAMELIMPFLNIWPAIPKYVIFYGISVILIFYSYFILLVV